jgi:hexosaminidase
MLLRAFDTKTEDPIELYRFKLPEVSEIMVPTPEIKAEMNGNEDYKIFNGPLTITLSCAEPNAEIRYTLDGSEPDEKSALYKNPFTIEQSCMLKARAFAKGKERSFEAVRCFEYHPIKNTTFVTPPVERYSKNADIALMDGKKGVAGDYYNDWLGFNGDNMEATIELNKPLVINVVKVGVCHEPNDWVMWPKAVWVSFSEDGTNFTEWKLAEMPMFDRPDRMAGHGRVEARARVNAKKVRFVRVKVENQGVLPDWHPYAGQRAWIMVDEVSVE